MVDWSRRINELSIALEYICSRQTEVKTHLAKIVLLGPKHGVEDGLKETLCDIIGIPFISVTFEHRCMSNCMRLPPGLLFPVTMIQVTVG